MASSAVVVSSVETVVVDDSPSQLFSLTRIVREAGHEAVTAESGEQAIALAARAIETGECDVAVAGGTESMSQAPHVVRGARWGLRLGPAVPFEDSLWEALTDTYCGFSMAQTAENLAEEYDISREEVDGYAVRSQTRAKEAWDGGRFDEEVVPVVLLKRGKESEFRIDEHIRPDTTPDALASLRPYFKKDGLVTAGNASGIGDGAAALVISDSEFAASHGLEPMGRLISWGVAGVPPRIIDVREPREYHRRHIVDEAKGESQITLATESLRRALDDAGMASRIETLEAENELLGRSAEAALRNAAPFPAMDDNNRCLSTDRIRLTFTVPQD